MSKAAVDKDVAGPDPPEDYGTPAYESRWIRKKLNLPPDAKTGVVQGAMHVQESHSHGYEAYITAYRCDDKQGEIARQSVLIEEQAAEIAVLRARLGRFDSMKIAALESRIEELLTAIRQHRDERGDDRCHADDGSLYAVLPEGDTRPAVETAVTLENCAKYIECRQTGREYVSPQRRIEELEAELSKPRADAAKWRAVCTPWTDDDTNGVSTWQGYTISHWTAQGWGPDGFEFDEGDIEAAKAACLEHFKTHGVT